MTRQFTVPRRVPALFDSSRFFDSPGFFDSDWDLGPFGRLFRDVRSGRTETPLFGAVTQAGFTPHVDVAETDDEIRFAVELPGLEDKDFEVLADGDQLIIKGEKRLERHAEHEGYVRTERGRGAFERRFRLDWEVDPDTVTASYRNGVLEIAVPKPIEARPKVATIPVTAS